MRANIGTVSVLSDLPPAFPDKTGWPWTKASRRLSDRMADGSAWPKISIVTPSYNQGQFLEETIRSVLLQEYPNLEYIVVDGGSTDGSVRVIEKYAQWLSYWVSEPDRGQAEAVNKGLRMAGGDLIGWLNSDDLYEPDVLGDVARAFAQNPGTSVVFGDCYFVDENNKTTGVLAAIDQPFDRKLQLWRGWNVPQPSTFVRREVLSRIGLLDESLDYVVDYDWFLRISRSYSFLHTGRVMSRYRIHGGSKTSSAGSKGDFVLDGVKSSRRYWGNETSVRFWRMQQSWFVYRLRAGIRRAVKAAYAALPRRSFRHT